MFGILLCIMRLRLVGICKLLILVIVIISLVVLKSLFLIFIIGLVSRSIFKWQIGAINLQVWVSILTILLLCFWVIVTWLTMWYMDWWWLGLGLLRLLMLPGIIHSLIFHTIVDILLLELWCFRMLVIWPLTICCRRLIPKDICKKDLQWMVHLLLANFGLIMVV